MVNLRNILNYKASSSCSFIVHHQLNTSFHGINYFLASLTHSPSMFSWWYQKLKICRHNFYFSSLFVGTKKIMFIEVRFRSLLCALAPKVSSLSPFRFLFSSLSLSFPFPILMIQNLPKKLSFFLFFSSSFSFFFFVLLRRISKYIKNKCASKKKEEK